MKSIARAALLLVAFCYAARAADNWPRFRGPTHDGHYTGPAIPTTWDDSSVVWKTPLKGFGQSSPVVWGDRIFLTTAEDGGRKRIVFCLSRDGGKLLWEREAPWKGVPEKLHNMNSFASATCATDGDVVAAFFGRGGLHGFSLDGEPLWSLDLGTFEGPWGTAASPVIVGDLVIQNCDADKDASIVGVDKRTGKVRWRTPRPAFRGWSTPVVVEAGGRTELAVNGHTALIAYDPAIGKELWQSRNGAGRGDPSVTPGGGLLFNVCGLKGPMYAVRPGGSGDVTSSHVAWTAQRGGGRDLPSAIVVGDYVLVTTMAGMLTCYDAGKGKELWTQRLGTKISSSPIAAGGLAYFSAETGETFVLKPGPKFEQVAAGKLAAAEDEYFRASLTPHAGQLLARSKKYLYCIGK
ncbi:MAG: PQQ-like beta-propeller repeat protein [Gemmataceae bacterium]|nr:PQQ-like beta-propeller repeat protein [Gemmataceae bacterium]